MRKPVTLLTIGLVLGLLVGATGAPADLAGSALRIAKKAQRDSASAKRVANRADRNARSAKAGLTSVVGALGKGARVDRGLVTTGMRPGNGITVTSRCSGAKEFPLGLSHVMPDGVVVVSEKRNPDGFTFTMQNNTGSDQTAQTYVDCLVGVDANNDPSTFGTG